MPEWKQQAVKFNDSHLEWLKKTVNLLIPWLVLLLLFIVIGEFAHDINYLIPEMGFHEINSLDKFGEFIHHHELEVVIIDYIIILFFAIDLYFKFCRCPTYWLFIRSNFIDILAVIPVGLLMGSLKLVSTEQQVTHVAIDSQKIAGKTAKGVKVGVRSTRILKLITRIPRFLRILRLRDLFKRESE